MCNMETRSELDLRNDNKRYLKLEAEKKDPDYNRCSSNCGIRSTVRMVISLCPLI